MLLWQLNPPTPQKLMSTTILIIDDTESNCEALSLNFEASGYAGDQKVVVNSLADGLKAIRTYPELRIILLDLNLPGVSPEAALSQVYDELKKVGNTHALPIPMSAFQKEEIEARMAGNRIVVSSPDIMNSVTGPKALSSVLEKAESQIERGEIKQEVAALKEEVKALSTSFNKTWLLWDLICRSPIFQTVFFAFIMIDANKIAVLWSFAQTFFPQSDIGVPTRVIETPAPRPPAATRRPQSPSPTPKEENLELKEPEN